MEKADFLEFFSGLSTGEVFHKVEKTCFFHYGSAPYRQLMENPKSYVPRAHFSKSLRGVWGKLNVPIFVQRPKREKVMHYKCPLADDF